MHPRALKRGGIGALAALAAAGAFAVPARAAVQPDNLPSPQAVLAHAEFLAHAPAPTSGAGTVCVIDTGVTPLPDLTDQVTERLSVVGGAVEDIYHHADDPFSGHGTFVAGTIASRVDGVGSAGIWPAAKIISVRVFRTPTGGATSADYRSAINECTQPLRHVSVITLSLGASFADADDVARLENKIINAHDYFNINVVASTGNDGNASAVNYPARFPQAFGVGGTDSSGAFCSFSNRGLGLDLSALGCDTYATAFDGRVGAFKGTSFAAPTVAGILVALRSYRPDLTAQQAEGLLLSAAQQTSAGPVVDASAAFRTAGLGGLVDAYVPPDDRSSSPGGEAVTHVEVTPTPEVVDRKPAKPKLRKASFVKRMLRVEVTRPPRGGVAVFRVGGRSYQRSNGRLVLRLRSWRTVTVLMQDEWGVRSDSLTVRRPKGSR
jgi:subtilisin family serine protease